MSFLPMIIQAQHIHTYVDADSLQVGDVFTYSIVLNGEYEGFSYPAEDAFGDHLEILSRQRYQREQPGDSLVYELQYFGTDDLMIDPLEFTVQNSESDTTLYTSRVPIFFKTTLEEGDDEFRPLKPIFDFAANYWLAILLSLLALLAGWLFYRWYAAQPTKEEAVPAPDPEPYNNPLDQLKSNLASLSDPMKLQGEKDFENFYVKMGDAIRLYIKRVYEFPALEMTTREITQNLQKELASSELVSITKKVLLEADIVKFANFQPSNSQAAEALNIAQKFTETATVMDAEKIRYLKYQYEIENGIIKPTDMPETERNGQL
ncbi:MAG: hypothetical protein WD008_01615 [Balneolaceae bacterium]